MMAGACMAGRGGDGHQALLQLPLLLQGAGELVEPGACQVLQNLQLRAAATRHQRHGPDAPLPGHGPRSPRRHVGKEGEPIQPLLDHCQHSLCLDGRELVHGDPSPRPPPDHSTRSDEAPDSTSSSESALNNNKTTGDQVKAAGLAAESIATVTRVPGAGLPPS